MADNNFRSDRNRDPLAELARLIGQGDAHAGGAAHQSYSSERSATMPAQVDWAPEDSYAAQDAHVDDTRYEERYATAPSAPAPAYSSYAPQEHDYEHEAPAGRYFSGTAAQFNGFRHEPDAYAYEEPPQLPPAHQLSDYGTESDDHYYDDAQQHGDEAHAAHEYYEEEPRSRKKSGLVVVMAIFGLAVIGTAGAFGYRAMFGSSVLPTLPPIIKANNVPIRIAPTAADAQAANAGDAKQAAPGTTGSTESIVSHEEQPLTIDPPKAAPRVVSTIPIITGANGGVPQAASAPAQNGQAVASATDTVWPPPPPMNPAPPASVAAPASASPPPQASAEPKRVHTVTIRADQASGDVAPGSTSPADAPVAREHSHSTTSRTSAPASGSNGPLSLVPGSQGSAPAAPSQRTRATQSANAPMAAASNNPAPAVSSGGGYVVQVSSQRSESEAQSAYRALQAKYPDQLGGRAATVRRVELGEKGTFYRNLVGPFASKEEAAQLCSGLMAAGHNCIVQRN